MLIFPSHKFYAVPVQWLVISDYTGYQYDSEWNLSSQTWSTRHSTTWHYRVCQTIASSLPPPGAVSFDHQTISSALSLLPVQHSLLLGHAFGTVFLHVSFGLICPCNTFSHKLKTCLIVRGTSA